MRTLICSLTALALFAVPALASAAEKAEPTAAEILKRYDEIMGPKNFQAISSMTAHREDGSERTYEMRFLRGENDRFRIWFDEPGAVKGQEMLRSGDNIWLYLPSLKRATRVANRADFQGGDFNNADVLRVNYEQDYDATLLPSTTPETYLVSLKAKNANTAYDAIKLWVRKKDLLPVRGEYYATSGDLLRSADFLQYTQFEPGYVRPARVVMHNELVKARFSELVTRRMRGHVQVPEQRFTLTDLGR